MTGMPPIVVELSVAASRQAVWKAITDPAFRGILI